MSSPTLIATGCYSATGSGRGHGVELLALDPATGTLESRARAELEDPSFLVWNQDGTLLHAVHETSPSRLTTLAVEDDGRTLRVLCTLELRGSGACHVALGQRPGTLMVADYGSGQIETIALDEAGIPTEVIDVDDHGSYRSDGPAHPHQAQRLPGTDLLAVPDLGLDRVYLYEQDPTGQIDLAGEVVLPRESGPRHITADHESSVLFIGCELSGELAMAVRDMGEDQLPAASWSVRAVTPASGREGENAVSHVEISERENHVFVANRGPDTLSAFALGLMRPELVAEVPVGAHPRDFARLADGLILVAAQEGDRIDVLRWDGRDFAVLGAHPSPSVTCVAARP